MCELCEKYQYCGLCCHEFKGWIEPITDKQYNYLLSFEGVNPEMFYDFDALFYFHNTPDCQLGDGEPFIGYIKSTKGQASFAIRWLTGEFATVTPFERHDRHKAHVVQAVHIARREIEGRRYTNEEPEVQWQLRQNH